MRRIKTKFAIPVWVHLISLAACGVAAVHLIQKYDELSSSPDKLFATISGAVGFYAAIFAIIELLRLRSVSKLVNESVDDIANKIHDLVNLKNYQDCQQSVDRIIQIIDAGESTPFSMIHELVKSYTYCFANEVSDPSSAHRQNRSELDLFCVAVTKSQQKAATQKLRPTMLSISTHLSTATAAAVNKNNPRG